MGGPGYIDGESHEETDNFGYATFKNADGVTFHCAEEYFQWCKCVNDADRSKVLASGSGWNAWSVGNSVTLRPDWEVVKVRCMMEGNKMKLEQHPELLSRLLPTKGPVQFGDYFWGRWNGQIMEYLRAFFRKNGEEDEATMAKFMRDLEEFEDSERSKLDEDDGEDGED